MSTQHDNTGIGGLIVFNSDGSATYFAKIDGKDVAKLRGHVDDDGGTFGNGHDTLVLSRKGATGKVKARGTATIAGTDYPVFALKNEPEGKPTSLGIRPDAPSDQVDCPW